MSSHFYPHSKLPQNKLSDKTYNPLAVKQIHHKIILKISQSYGLAMVYFGKNLWCVLALCLFATSAIALDVTGSITSGGISRSLVFHAPGSAVASNLPLVIVMHGNGGNGSAIKSYSGFDAASNTSNFIAGYPNAVSGANTYSSSVDIIAGIKKLILCQAGTVLKEVSLIRILGGNHG